MLILVVEDHPLVAVGLQALLEDAGHDVLGPAETVAQALDLAAVTRPDLALVDISLKGSGTGIDVARELRRRWGLAVLFISSQQDRARAARDAALGCLRKPFPADALVDSLEIISRFRDGQEISSRPPELELFQAV